MKIIEIKKTTSGREVAYIFDEQRGKIYKTLVEDLTGTELEEDEPVYSPRPEPTRRAVRRVPIPQNDFPLEENDMEDSPTQPLPDKPAPQVIPPRFRDLLTPPM